MTKQNNLTPKEKFTAATYMGKNWDTFEGMGIKEAAAAMADVLQRPVTVSNITTVADMAGVDLSSRGLGSSELDELREAITAIHDDVDKLTASLSRLWERDAPLQAGDHGTLEEKII